MNTVVKQKFGLTELEQVRLCAIAMGLNFHEVSHNDPERTIRLMYIPGNQLCTPGYDCFWPIKNDVQAMAIAKRFVLKLDLFAGAAELPFPRTNDMGNESNYTAFSDVSINYSIVECIAEMQLHSPVKPEEYKIDDAAIDLAAAGGVIVKY